MAKSRVTRKLFLVGKLSDDELALTASRRQLNQLIYHRQIRVFVRSSEGKMSEVKVKRYGKKFVRTVGNETLDDNIKNLPILKISNPR